MYEVNRFRMKRGKRLAAWITARAAKLGHAVEILDVGGRPSFWENVVCDAIDTIHVLNLESTESLKRPANYKFNFLIGDATELTDIETESFDIYHSNSVIEHVGSWQEMLKFASEARRVACNGWVQTPAYEFPIEPHLRTPFVHWLGTPTRRRLMRNPPWLKDRSLSGRRAYADTINLVSRAEFRCLFSTEDIWTERVFGLPKSYVAYWSRGG